MNSSKHPVGVYTNPSSGRSVIVVILSEAEGISTVLVGPGIRDGTTLSVPTGTVKRISDLSLEAHHPVLQRYMDQSAKSLVGASGGSLDQPTTSGESAMMMPSIADSVLHRQSTSVRFLRRAMLAPFDSIVSWCVPPATLVFVVIAIVVALIRSSSTLLHFLPMIRILMNDVDGFVSLLMMVALVMAVVTSFGMLEDSEATDTLLALEKKPSAHFAHVWRWLAALPVILVTAVTTIHREWPEHEQRTTLLGQFASAVFPWLSCGIDEALLYTVAVVAVLNRIIQR